MAAAWATRWKPSRSRWCCWTRPSAALLSSEAGVAQYAGQDTSLVAQGDVHQTAAHTFSSVSGQTTSWYTREGGVKAYAANGPVSLRAHTDSLQILADNEVTVISVNDEIRIQAKTKIEVIGGDSSMVLEGGDITFNTPGKFEVKGAGHAFLGGAGQAAQLAALPTSTTFRERFQLKERSTGLPKPNARYWVTVAGVTTEGFTDELGFTHTVFTEGPQSISLEVEEDGLELRA